MMLIMIQYGKISYFLVSSSKKNEYILYLSCRWAQNTSALDECGDICGKLPGSTFDNETCTLVFNTTGKQAGDLYPVAFMVEDYYNESSDTSFSSVSVQFLIQIIPAVTCYSKPTISSNISANTIVAVGSSIQFTLTMQTNCSGTSIVDLFRASPLNMYKSNLTQVGLSNVWTVTERWTPTSEQTGSQTYCAMATNRYTMQFII